jgi:hypothetical protein
MKKMIILAILVLSFLGVQCFAGETKVSVRIGVDIGRPHYEPVHYRSHMPPFHPPVYYRPIAPCYYPPPIVVYPSYSVIVSPPVVYTTTVIYSPNVIYYDPYPTRVIVISGR